MNDTGSSKYSEISLTKVYQHCFQTVNFDNLAVQTYLEYPTKRQANKHGQNIAQQCCDVITENDLYDLYDFQQETTTLLTVHYVHGNELQSSTEQQRRN